MALTGRTRAIAYRSLQRIFDDEETTAAVVSTLAIDTEQLATKGDVVVLDADLRGEIHAAKTSMVMWFVGITTTQLGVILGFLLALR